jgi:hypothetical protein
MKSADKVDGRPAVSEDRVLVERALPLVGARAQPLLELADHHRPQLLRRQATARPASTKSRFARRGEAERGLARPAGGGGRGGGSRMP